MRDQRELQKKLYDKRRARLQCLWCGKPLDREGSLCQACCDRCNTDSKERRKYLKKIGRCTKCGQNKATNGFATCNSCREKAARKARENRQNNTEAANTVRAYQKALRDKRRKEGLCTECGKNVPEKGFARCNECRKRQRRYRKTYYTKYQLSDRYLWKSQGKCSRCGSDDIHEGTSLCEKCYGVSCEALAKARKVVEGNRAKARAEIEAEEQEKMRFVKIQYKPRTLWERKNKENE